MKKIKFAVIGLGHIGKRHAEMVRRNPDAELVAVADILPKDKTGFEGDVPYFSSIDDNTDMRIGPTLLCQQHGLTGKPRAATEHHVTY